MKAKFKMQGLECASCAAKLEDKLNRIDGINNVVLNFMTMKLSFEAGEEYMESVLAQARQVASEIEKGVILEKI